LKNKTFEGKGRIEGFPIQKINNPTFMKDGESGDITTAKIS
jgi:hypothetical protein